MLDPDLIARFRADLDLLLPAQARLGLAVSGGPDSMAMLLLAHAALPDRIEAATVNHGLRQEAGAEADLAAKLCARLGVAHRTLAITVPSGNVQSMARRARYAALAAWLQERGLAALASAHHADDQAETLLMRLNRASGVAGLAGVRARGAVPGSDLPLIRPLLGWRRAELAQIIAHAQVEVAHDLSNLDEKFDRVRLRSALRDNDWIDPAAVAASAVHLADADDALAWVARREWDEQVKAETGQWRYAPCGPKAIRLRVLAMIIADAGGAARGGEIARLLGVLEAGQGATLAGLAAKAEGGDLVFSREPPRSRG